jgi:hypothetical protein
MGKTTDLLDMAEDTNLLIVTHTYESAIRLGKEIKRCCRNILPPVGIHGLQTYLANKEIDGILIDNAEMVMRVLIAGKYEIKAMAMTGVPEVDFNEVRDINQYEDFKRARPDLTYQEFSTFKYGTKVGG